MSVADTYVNYAPDWWTPQEWLEWVKRTLRDPKYHDPCPTVYPSAPDGLDESLWNLGRTEAVYVNHPGGPRGVSQQWWGRMLDEQWDRHNRLRLVWCAFNVEQLRILHPSPLELHGWLVMPRSRIAFIWGGADVIGIDGKVKRRHGEPCKSPSNWAVFWTTEPPARTPVESIVVRTGV